MNILIQKLDNKETSNNSKINKSLNELEDILNKKINKNIIKFTL